MRNRKPWTSFVAAALVGGCQVGVDGEQASGAWTPEIGMPSPEPSGEFRLVDVEDGPAGDPGVDRAHDYELLTLADGAFSASLVGPTDGCATDACAPPPMIPWITGTYQFATRKVAVKQNGVVVGYRHENRLRLYTEEVPWMGSDEDPPSANAAVPRTLLATYEVAFDGSSLRLRPARSVDRFLVYQSAPPTPIGTYHSDPAAFTQGEFIKITFMQDLDESGAVTRLRYRAERWSSCAPGTVCPQVIEEERGTYNTSGSQLYLMTDGAEIARVLPFSYDSEGKLLLGNGLYTKLVGDNGFPNAWCETADDCAAQGLPMPRCPGYLLSCDTGAQTCRRLYQPIGPFACE